jgi:hypothetical protein
MAEFIADAVPQEQRIHVAAFATARSKPSQLGRDQFVTRQPTAVNGDEDLDANAIIASVSVAPG